MSLNIDTKISNGIMTLRFDRPEKKNALTVSMYQDCVVALGKADNDPGVRVVIFTGSGDSFSAGNDLADFLEHPLSHEDEPVYQFVNALATFSKPVIAAVNGVAVGIGTTMLLHCDLAYAVPSAKFQFPFINLAIVPEFASTLLVPRLVGRVRAAELLLIGEPFSASRAAELGLINDVVSPDDLLSTVLAKAELLSAKPPSALRASKALLRADHAEVCACISKENRVVREHMGSPEFREAATAFFEKRRPDFSKFD